MKKLLKKFLARKRWRPVLPEPYSLGLGGVRANQSTSNPVLCAQTTSHSDGCETLFEGPNSIVADIVFVHGLRGHQMKTWTKDNVCWPRDLLSKEESLSRIRVLTFGYDANIVNLNGCTSLNSLFDHSFNLLLELSRVRKDSAKDRPIVFVAHSLGGIIVKDALNQSENVQDTHPHLAHIVSATRGIVFLGTPHRGSGMTSLANVVASVVQIAMCNTNVNLIRDLERDSQTLDRIRDSFRRILGKRRLSIWSFVEELAISGVGKVVCGDSAIIDYSRETRGTIYADHIGMAKFSSRDDPGYKKVLYAIEMILEGHSEDTSASSNQRTIETVYHEVTTFYDIPPIRAPHFVARNAPLARLNNLFEQSTTTMSRFIVVLIGMGGVGKTQLILEFCLHMKDSGNFRGIFWLDASSRNSLYRGMEVIAKWLLPGRVFDNPDDAITSVKDTLSKWTDGWLIVIDNFDNPSELRDIRFILPDSRRGFIAITSRHAGSKELGHVIEVDCMERTEGLQLFLQSSEEPDEVAAAEEILARLGYLPLVIDQARAYISRRQLRLRDFADEFEARMKNIMKETPRFWQYCRTLPDNRKVSLSLLTTWEMSLALLGVEEDKRMLKEVLSLFAFFHPVSISENLFRLGESNRFCTYSPMSIFDDNGQWNHLKFEDAVLQMQDLSLLRFSHRSSNEIVVSLHSMVSEWLRMRLDEDSRSALFSTAVSHLEDYLGSTEHNDHTIRQEALSHIDIICKAEEFRVKSSSFVGACSTFGMFYSHQGHLEGAERMFSCALSGNEEALGPEHMSTLDTLINLGNVYTDQGRLEDAEWMYNRALVGCENVLGPEHTFALGTVNNLGLLYVDQGRLEDAEGMYKRALAGFEEASGPGHRSTLDTVNNLGLLYAKQGRLGDAERMYDRALAGKEETLGHEHTSTLDTVYNFGNLYKNQSRLGDAERMYNRALAGYEVAWGPEHLSTLKTVNNLAFVYAKQGLLEDAERMYSRALVGKEKALGPGHTSTLKTVRNLRNLCKARERREDAVRIRDHI